MNIKSIIFLFTSLFSTFSYAYAQNLENIRFIDAKELMLLGKGFENTESYYTRLPLDQKNEIRPEVWDLGRNSAGMAVRFYSNTTTVAVKWKILNNFHMNHMPDTGVKGVDLYSLEGNGQWYYMGTGKPVGVENKAILSDCMERKGREYILYLPLYDGIVDLEIGVDSTAELSLPRNNRLVKCNDGKAIIVYGTSITQGGCASRPGMAYTSILGRMLDREVINLGFSGNARLDNSLAKAICRINSNTVVLDCLPNTTAQMLKDSAYKFLRIILDAKPGIRLYMVENPLFPALRFNNKIMTELSEENWIWRSIYLRLRREGFNNVNYIKGAELVGEDNEGTVDGVHMSDLGFYGYANILSKYLSSSKHF